jgi:molecular chaperone DnaK (HSP70)
MAEIVIGIDFGTSYTSAGALVDGRVVLVQDQGDAAMPSLVYVPKSGDLVVGHRAAARMTAEPTAVIPSIKRLLGVPASSDAIRKLPAIMPQSFKIAGTQIVVTTTSGEVACEQVASALFSKVRDLAEHRFGCSVRRAVVAVPAAATPSYTAALRRAAKLAHIEIAQLISEPIAGALAIGLHGEMVRRRVLVCDFGGGTFDVTAVVQDGLKFMPVATAGEEYLGGDDLDAALADALAGAVYKRSRFQILDDILRKAQLLQRCESIKRTLTSQPEVRLTMRDAFIEGGKQQALDVIVDRNWVEGIWRPLITRALDAIGTTLARAQWGTDDIERVVLIGGSSQVRLFRASLDALFGEERVSTLPSAGLAVAMGTTLVTATLTKQRVPQPSLATEDDGIPIHFA